MSQDREVVKAIKVERKRCADVVNKVLREERAMRNPHSSRALRKVLSIIRQPDLSEEASK